MSEQELWIVVEEPVKGARDSTIDTGGGFDDFPATIANVFKRRVPVDAAALKSQMNGFQGATSPRKAIPRGG